MRFRKADMLFASSGKQTTHVFIRTDRDPFSYQRSLTHKDRISWRGHHQHDMRRYFLPMYARRRHVGATAALALIATTEIGQHQQVPMVVYHLAVR